MIDILTIPDGLDRAVCEPVGKNILYRLLAKIMIDTVNLRLIYHGV